MVLGELTAKAFPAEAKTVFSCHARVGKCLDDAGLAWTSLTDAEVAAGKLSSASVAVFPYNTRLSAQEKAAIERFVTTGGKLVWFYAFDRDLADVLGVAGEGLFKPRGGAFSGIRLEREWAKELPAFVSQRSWHALKLVPETGTRVIGRWVDARGRRTSVPALTANENGVVFGHVLLRGDLQAKGQLLLAVCGHYKPSLWMTAVKTAVARASRVSSLESLEAVETYVKQREAVAVNGGAANTELQAAIAVRDRALASVGKGQRLRALAEARSVRKHVLLAYEFAQPSRAVELRGVWLHTAYGVGDWGWQRSLQVLAESGFNAIFPNMCWAGKADYFSSILPVTRKARQRGDQLAQCVQWAHRYGIEVHVWKVCFNLSTAPNWFVRKLHREGRLQQGKDGRELRRKWLCPTNPKNIRLETASLLEIAKKYRVDGLHLDYIRYPGAEGCYCPVCRRAFEKQLGHAVADWPDDVVTGDLQKQWQQFRRDRITRLLESVREGLRAQGTPVKLSVAVYGSWKLARRNIAQDAKVWVDKGLVDFVCPMNYTESLSFQRRLTTKQVRAVYGRVPVYAGIGVYSGQSWFTSPDELLDQIEAVRNAGADGFVLFQYRPQLAEAFLPALKRGVTARPATPPHEAPAFDFQLTGGSRAFAVPTFRVGTPVAVRIEAPSVPNLHVHRVCLQQLDGRVVTSVRGAPPLRPGGRFQSSLTPARGWYRVVVYGSTRPADRPPRPFAAASPVIHVADSAEVEAQEWKNRPPPQGHGLRVGIWQDGYGSTGLFIALRRDSRFLPFYLRESTPKTLRACRVVLLAQPRNPTDLSPRTVAGLTAFVRNGGGLLLTHEACGFRDCPPLFPALFRGVDLSRDRTWRVAVPHPVTATLDTRGTYTTTYRDLVLLAPVAGDVQVVVVDSSGRPVVLAAEVGKGRVMACGLALGLDLDEDDVQPGPEETTLLRNAVRWLGR